MYEKTELSSSYISLNHCGYSPLHTEAFRGSVELLEAQARLGSASLDVSSRALVQFHEAGAALLGTDAMNISFLPNSATGLNLIALGYPFEPGDEILSYRYEYPSNHYPWRSLESKGVKLKLIDGLLDGGRPLKWELDELAEHVTDKTKMIALSHVQFVSGFSADLEAVGSFCSERGIKFVVDATQSVGCMPVYPERVGIDALVVSGWKWLMGPIGTALLYTSPTFRPQVRSVLAGPSMMQQGANYLDHSYNPVACGGRFEFSTLPPSMVAALGTVIDRVVNKCGIEAIWSQVQNLQNVLLAEIDSSLLKLVPLSEKERDGILSFTVEGEAYRVVWFLKNDGIICSARGTPDGKVYIRCAPHFYLTENEVRKAARALGDAVRVVRGLSSN